MTLLHHTNNGEMHHVSTVVMCLVYRYMYTRVCTHVVLQRTSVCVCASTCMVVQIMHKMCMHVILIYGWW